MSWKSKLIQDPWSGYARPPQVPLGRGGRGQPPPHMTPFSPLYASPGPSGGPMQQSSEGDASAGTSRPVASRFPDATGVGTFMSAYKVDYAHSYVNDPYYITPSGYTPTSAPLFRELTAKAKNALQTRQQFEIQDPTHLGPRASSDFAENMDDRYAFDKTISANERFDRPSMVSTVTNLLKTADYPWMYALAVNDMRATEKKKSDQFHANGTIDWIDDGSTSGNRPLFSFDPAARGNLLTTPQGLLLTNRDVFRLHRQSGVFTDGTLLSPSEMKTHKPTPNQLESLAREMEHKWPAVLIRSPFDDGDEQKYVFRLGGHDPALRETSNYSISKIFNAATYERQANALNRMMTPWEQQAAHNVENPNTQDQYPHRFRFTFPDNFRRLLTHLDTRYLKGDQAFYWIWGDYVWCKKYILPFKDELRDRVEAYLKVSLNNEQWRAAWRHTPFQLVSGPPGTGKTATLTAKVILLVLRSYERLRTDRDSFETFLAKGKHHSSKGTTTGPLIIVTAAANQPLEVVADRFNSNELLHNMTIWFQSKGQENVLPHHPLSQHALLRTYPDDELQRMIAFYDDGNFYDPGSEEEAKYNCKYTDAMATLMKTRTVVITTLSNLDGRYGFFMGFCIGAIIIDEAAQASEPETCIAMTMGCRCLCLFGDTKQLGPTVLDCTWYSTWMLMQVSLMERLRLHFVTIHSERLKEQGQFSGKDVEYSLAKDFDPLAGWEKDTAIENETLYRELSTDLRVQYRMREGMVDLLNTVTYTAPGTQLISHFDASNLLERESKLLECLGQVPWEQLLTANTAAGGSIRSSSTFDSVRERGVLFVDAAGGGRAENEKRHSGVTTSFQNSYHTLVSGRIATLLTNAGIVETDVAVCCLYKGQQLHCRSEFRKHGLSTPVTTVNKLQGSEKDIVILDLVRSNYAGHIGFLLAEERLNVALSRARFLLVVVGDANTLIVSGARKFANLMQWADQNGVSFLFNPR